ncbi:MAG: hypothetical protein ACK5P5_06805 [Pseudobdellovibrionaceae bacterium]
MHSDQITADLRAHFQLQDFQLVLKKEWASTQDQYRQKIRQYIFDTVHSDEKILELHERPWILGRGLSISHNRICGGFMTSSEHQHIGFDMEINERLHVANISRYSVNKNESAQAPTAACLWTAKEAAFKAIPKSDQPNVIGQIEIGDWNQISAHLFTCRMIRIKNKIVMDSLGLVSVSEHQTYAFFKLTERIPCAGF